MARHLVSDSTGQELGLLERLELFPEQFVE